MMKGKKIMVFRFSAMGDVAMAVPVLKALVEQNKVQVSMVSRAFFAPFFQSLPNIEFISVDLKNEYKGLGGLISLYRKLKKIKPDAVADLHDVLRTKVLRCFFQASGTKVKKIDKGRKEKKALTREKNKIFIPLQSTQERYADVFRKLGFHLDLSKVEALPKPKESSQVSLFFQTFEGQKTIGIAPFAAHKGKQYPFEKIKEVIKILLESDTEINIILFGGGEEEKRKLAELEKINRNRVVNIAGLFSLEEELQILSRLDVLLSMDSGNAHMAAMYAVPIVNIWGATHPYAGFAPFNQKKENQILPDLEKYPQLPTSVYGNKIFPGFEKIWEDITPESVVKKLQDELSR